ncbi:hypothetical protein LFYK43_04830 [Ligilactobacillus salitolerans]|uniref:Right handed beta helix domain-containing protein n=1 Tax=Ligilactobacillus salitolerans TaxID=1808352 RepID=A0A401IRA4_9LACO|nr:right-handed parallel beta-helix repeat-containing protein [Ligilactobacillus salitolerans]GBG94024.1 hypothetical protein LFYK43_04830 [Ligilactobacillus salitolerans]
MRNILKFILALSLALLFKLPSANAQTIHVSLAATQAGTGSAAQPFKAINSALKKARAGDKVVVHGGTYHEKIHFPHSGRNGLPITLCNFQSDKVVVDGSKLHVAGDMEGLLTIRNRRYLKVQGLTVQNFTSRNQQVPAGILITGTSKGISIKDCHVGNIAALTKDTAQANAHAIAIYGTSSKKPLQKITLIGNEIDHNRLGSSETVAVNGNVRQFKISKNRIHDNDNIGIDLIGYERTAAKHDYARDGVVTQNEIWNISTKDNPAYQAPSSAAIYADGARNIKIQRNKIHKADIGIEAASEHHGRTTKKIVIRNNLVVDCRPIAGISFGGYDKKRGKARSIRILNNTLVNNPTQILVQHYAQDSFNVIQNNIFADGKQFTGKLGKIKQKPNYTGKPHFVAPQDGDFRLEQGSPAKNTAKLQSGLGIKDLAGKARVVNDKVSFGAYQ